MRNNFELPVIKTLLVIAFFAPAHFSFSQESDSIKQTAQFNGAVTLTTKGISTIPNLTLGKPAVIFDLSIGKRKLFFEPQLRFALEGKPWSFLFWWRYELEKSDKFLLKIGTHPALAFKTIKIEDNGETKELIRVQRYFAGELAPSYFINKNFSVGMYYLYSYGIEKTDITKHTHFISVRSNISNINISDQIYMRLNPQFYYLKMDAFDGTYFNGTLAFSKRNFPLSVSALVNKAIHTRIPVGEDFIWNISLIYNFSKKYLEI